MKIFKKCTFIHVLALLMIDWDFDVIEDRLWDKNQLRYFKDLKRCGARYLR
jgi:hypothetical protein